MCSNLHHIFLLTLHQQLSYHRFFVHRKHFTVKSACPSIRSTASASLRTRTVLSMQSTAWHGPWSSTGLIWIGGKITGKPGNFTTNPAVSMTIRFTRWKITGFTMVFWPGHLTMKKNGGFSGVNCPIQFCELIEMIWPGLFDGWPHTCPNLHTARCVVHSDGRKKEHRTGGRFERTSKCIESGFADLWVSNLVFA